jgi:glycosyltransferase involved in cell wall biosynthesis
MTPRIVGIVMVKNEELTIAEVLTRIADFCDYIRFIDTGSTDDTEECARAALDHANVPYDVFYEEYLTHTHQYVEPYVGTDTWVFGVDGDELYHPSDLAAMRKRLKTGHAGYAYQLKGMYLHVDRTWIAEDGRELAQGWLGPPSHNPTKLYNFANIESWSCDWQRTLFHAKTRRVRKGTTVIHALTPWHNAELRCVHLRWLPRTQSEVIRGHGGRLTPEDIIGKGSRKERGGHDDSNDRLSYQVGKRHTVDLDTFEEVRWLST